jgi:toxin FitB
VFDLQVAALWAKIQAAGKVMPIMDSMIAATAISNGLAVATRNIADMEASGAVLINPWSA